MSKTKKNISSPKTQETFWSKFNLEEFLPNKYHIMAVILIIIILFLIFLNPLYFGNKTFQSGDIISSLAMQPYVENHTNGYTLWNPLIFCGMPAYAIGVGYKWFNLIYVAFTSIRSVFASFFSVSYAMWSFYLILLGATSFFLMRYLTKSTLVSLFTAVATAFSTGIIVFLYIGHVTKLTSLCMYPVIFLMLLRFKEKIRLIDFLILIIALQLFLQGFHLQIIFYTFAAVLIYHIYFLLHSFIKKEQELTGRIVKSALLFLAALTVAGLIQLDNFTQIYQYMPYSTRGSKGIIEKTTAQTEKYNSDYYSYHTDWSFSPQEISTFIIPSFYGFGNVTYNGPLTHNQDYETNTYFGQMPFVDVAVGYMGIIVFFFALVGIFSRWKEPFVRFLTILSGIALLLSFGKNFPVLFDLLFYYLPYFDKFRVPSMVLVLVQLSVPILAGLGLMKIISLKKDKDRSLIKLIKNLAITFSGIFILGLLLNSSLSGWMVDRVNDYANSIVSSQRQRVQLYKALATFIGNMFTTDFLFSFGFLSAAFWGAYLYIQDKLSKDILVLGVIILTIIDLWRIDARGERYSNNLDINKEFNTPEYVKIIKNQKDNSPFRILNLEQDGSMGSISRDENYNAYFGLEDLYGYSAIKPRAFQDYMDVVGPANPTLWRMLNVKYIVANTDIPFPGMKEIKKVSKTYVFENTNALGRLYFVDTVETKPDINVLRSVKANKFDPKKVAYVNGIKPNIEVPDSTASVKITDYQDEIISAEVNASGNNFLFLGNTYLPTGWKAYIDGEKTKIYRVNHGFMGITVPPGKHTIEFKYAPISFYISKYLSLILSSLVLIGIIYSVFTEIRKRKINIPQKT